MELLCKNALAVLAHVQRVEASDISMQQLSGKSYAIFAKIKNMCVLALEIPVFKNYHTAGRKQKY